MNYTRTILILVIVSSVIIATPAQAAESLTVRSGCVKTAKKNETSSITQMTQTFNQKMHNLREALRLNLKLANSELLRTQARQHYLEGFEINKKELQQAKDQSITQLMKAIALCK